MKVVPLIFTFLSAAASTGAFAQQQGPIQTPSEQALTMKLSEEINAGMQDRVALIAARRKVDELQKQLDDLKPKAETPKSVELPK